MCCGNCKECRNRSTKFTRRPRATKPNPHGFRTGPTRQHDPPQFKEAMADLVNFLSYVGEPISWSVSGSVFGCPVPGVASLRGVLSAQEGILEGRTLTPPSAEGAGRSPPCSPCACSFSRRAPLGSASFSRRADPAMTSNRPYLIRALYEWIEDNGLTPHLLVNAELPGVEVPKQHVQDGQIVLNINSIGRARPAPGQRMDRIQCPLRWRRPHRPHSCHRRFGYLRARERPRHGV
jgi:hypothetical protein